MAGSGPQPKSKNDIRNKKSADASAARNRGEQEFAKRKRDAQRRANLAKPQDGMALPEEEAHEEEGGSRLPKTAAKGLTAGYFLKNMKQYPQKHYITSPKGSKELSSEELAKIRKEASEKIPQMAKAGTLPIKPAAKYFSPTSAMGADSAKAAKIGADASKAATAAKVAATGGKAAKGLAGAAKALTTAAKSTTPAGWVMIALTWGGDILKLVIKIGKYVLLGVAAILLLISLAIQSGLILGSKLLNPLNIVNAAIAFGKTIPILMPVAYGMELGMQLADLAIKTINKTKPLIIEKISQARNLLSTTKTLVQDKMNQVMDLLGGSDGITKKAEELRKLENKKESELTAEERKKRNDLRKELDDKTKQAIITVKEAQNAVKEDPKLNNQIPSNPSPQSQLINQARAEEGEITYEEVSTYFEDVKESLEALNMSARLKNRLEIINAKDRTTFERYEELRKLVNENPAAKVAYEKEDYGDSSPIKDYQDLPPIDIKVIELIDYLVMPSAIFGEGHNYLEIARINGEFTSDNREMSTENEYADSATEESENNVSRHHDGRAVDVSGMDYIKCTEVVYEQVPESEGTLWMINWDETKPKDPIPIKFAYRTDQGLGGANGTGKGSGFDNILSNILKSLTNGSFTMQGVLGQLPQIILGQFFGQILQNNGINVDLGQQFPDFHGGGANFISWITNQMVNSQWNLPANTAQGANFAQNVENMGAVTANKVFNEVLPIASFDGDNFTGFMRNIGREWLTEKMLLPSGSLKGASSEKIIKRAGQTKLEVALGLSEGSLANLTNRADLEKTLGQGYIEKTLGLTPGSFAGNLNSVLFDAIFGSDKKKEVVARALGISRADLDAGLANHDYLKQKVGEQVLAQNITDFYKNYAYQDPAQNSSGGANNNCNQDLGDNIYCLNSRDEAFDLVDYNKPYLYKAGQPLPSDIDQQTLNNLNNDPQNPVDFYMFDYNYGTYGQYTPDTQPNITPIRKIRESAVSAQNPLGINISNLSTPTREYYPIDYERSLEIAQKDNSVIKRLLDGANYPDLFKEIGIDAVAKGLSNVDKERFYIREWLYNYAGETGDQAIPKDKDTGREIFDPDVLGQRIGLKDRYDLDRIFISNRGDEVLERLGQSLFRESINPSSGNYLNSMYLNNSSDADNSNSQNLLLTTKLNAIKEIVNALTQAQKQEINGYIGVINTAASQQQASNLNALLLNEKHLTISKNLYLIGKVIYQNNLQNNPKGQEILKSLAEIIQGQNFDPLDRIPEDNFKTASQLNMGISTSLMAETIKKLYNNSTSIKEIKKDFGFRALALALDMDEIDGAKIKAAYNEYEANPTSPNIVQKIVDNLGRENLEKAARNLNYSLNINDTNARLNADDVAWILTGTAGRWQVLLPKVSGALSAILTGTRGSTANTNYIYDLLSGINVGQINIANIPIGPLGAGADLNQITSLIGNLSSNRYTVASLEQGINLIPNILGYAKVLDPDFDNAKYEKLLDNFKKYYQDGAQILTTIESFKNFFGNDGWHIADAISHAGSFTNMLKENSVLQSLNFIKISFPGIDVDSYFRSLFPNMNIGMLEGLRVSNFLSVIGSNDLRAWVNAASNSINWENNQDSRAAFNFASQFVTGQVSQSAIMTQTEAFLRRQQGMENMPIGFMGSMFTGNVTNRAAAVAQWGLNNGLQDGSISQEQAGYLNSAIGVLRSGNITPGAIQNTAISYISTNLPRWLGPDGMGLSSTFASQLTGPVTNVLQGNPQAAVSAIQGIGTSFVQKEISKFFDKQIRATIGTTEGIRGIVSTNIVGDRPGIAGGFNVGNLQNIQGGFSKMTVNAISALAAGFLGEQFAGLEESLGLPQGTFAGVFASIIPSFFIPGYSIASALISQFLPQILGNINLGPLGTLTSVLGASGSNQKQKEVWCAMDYYPLYDDEKIYDEEFGTSAPPATPYDFSGTTVEHGKGKALDKEKEKIGDGSGGFAKTHQDKIFINLNEFTDLGVGLIFSDERKGEFKLSRNNTNLIKEKMKAAAEFKVKQLLADLIRINEPDGAPPANQSYVTEKTDDLEMLPSQIGTYKAGDFDPQYLYKLNYLYGEEEMVLDNEGNATDSVSIVATMKENMESGIRRGMWPDEKYFGNFVHVGY